MCTCAALYKVCEHCRFVVARGVVVVYSCSYVSVALSFIGLLCISVIQLCNGKHLFT